MSQTPPSRPQKAVDEQAASAGASQTSQAAPSVNVASGHSQPTTAGQPRVAPGQGGEAPHYHKPRTYNRDFANRRNSYTKQNNTYHHHTNSDAGGHHYPHNNHNGGNENNTNAENTHFRGPRNQAYPRFNTHGGHHGHVRGPSFQGTPGYANPGIIESPVFSTVYPVYDNGAYGRPPHLSGSPQLAHFVPVQPHPANSKVVMTDANGNPIDLKEKLKSKQSHSVSASSTPTPTKDQSPAAGGTSSAAPAPAAGPKESASNTESTPEVTKSGTAANDAAAKLKELIARKRQEKLAEEAKLAQKAEQPAKEQAVAPAAPVPAPATSAAAPATEEPRQNKEEPQPEIVKKVETAKPELKEEPKVEEPKATETLKEEPKVEQSKETTAPAEQTERKPAPAAAPKPGKWIPPVLRRKMEMEAQQAKEAAASSDKPAEDSAKPETAKDDEPVASASAPASAASAAASVPAAAADSPEPKTAAPAPAAPATLSEEPAAAAAPPKPEESNEVKSQKFKAQLETAHYPSVEEVAAFKYPANVIGNPEIDASKGVYRYSPDFLFQFSEKVPRAHYESFRKIVGFEYQSTITRWGSGMGARGGLSSRGSSRSGSHVGFGGPSGRGGGRNGGSVRGRNNSRRKGDRQGSRRDRDENGNNINNADLPPLQKSENAWVPSFLKKQGDDAAAAATKEDDGRLSPEEVQRKVKSLLNKMAWENFDKIAAQIREISLQSINESNAFTLRQVIQLTFDKAIDEPHWSSMYASFFLYLHHGAGQVPAEVVDESDPERVLRGVPVLRRYLLNMSQQEFEKGWGEISQIGNNVAVMSDEYYQAIALKRRGLGLTQLIGELYKLGLVSENLVTSCFARLAAEEPTEDIVESMSKLIRTVATTMIQREKGGVIDLAMGTLAKWKDTANLAARLRFKIMDMEDLRKKNWAGCDETDGPKTIAQVHLDALRKEQEAEREKMMKSRQGSRRGGDFGRSASNRSRK